MTDTSDRTKAIPTTLITGATGSFGSALAKYLLNNSNHRLRLLGRSESRLESLQSTLAGPRTTFILGDIRDRSRMSQVFSGVDYVYHAAALKIAPMSVSFTTEFVKTNIAGTLNVIDAAMECKVKRLLFISSDKAVAPGSFNEYGKTKAVAEGMIREANMRTHDTRFASVRGGNVWGSRGSVVEKWLASKTIGITDPLATRFHLPMYDWLVFCTTAMREMHGGEVFVPKCCAWTLGHLASAFSQSFADKTVESLPLRDGDKLHETLLSDQEVPHSQDIDWAYVVEPGRTIRESWAYTPHVGDEVTGPVSSDTARKMTIEELRRLL